VRGPAVSEIPDKPFFLTIEKDHEHPKQDIYLVHLFYLLNYRRGQLEYREEPFFTARLEIFLERSHWLPFRFFFPPLTTGMDPRFLDDHLFAKIAAAAEFCAIPETEEKSVQETLLDLFSRLGVEKVEKFTFCEHCLLKNKFTFLDTRSVFRGTNRAKVCQECAGADLISRVRYAVEMSTSFRNVLRDLLNKFKDVDKVANIFGPNIHNLQNPDFSLYDCKKELIQKVDRKKVTLDQLPLPKAFITRLQQKGYSELLPAQVLAVEAGLLEGASELIVSATSSGKTLIAEIAGVPKLLRFYEERKREHVKNVPKLIYVVPLVALANQRGDEWSHRYHALGLNVATKVGLKQFDPEARKARSAKSSVSSADIIVGTYEGIDVMLRKARGDLLGTPATIVIDEIQMLGDGERGWFLDGFISRLRVRYPRAQFLYLSATVAQPVELANQLHAQLVEYGGRPVPIERHFILCTSSEEKTRVAAMLIKNEFLLVSKLGFKGQTILFTNSRRKCHHIASTLQEMGIISAAYHAGLTYGQRRRIEKAFVAQTVMCVVTTAALGAGLDLPASQVIFESLAMGRKWLTVAEFEQMLGRAGRLGKHERGKVVILAEAGNQVVPGDHVSEEQVALHLLKGKIAPLTLDPDEMRGATELLGFLAMVGTASFDDLIAFNASLYHRGSSPQSELQKLVEGKFAERSGDQVSITTLGRATVEHFLTIEEANQVLEALEAGLTSLLDFALEMRPFQNLYVSNKMVTELAGRGKSGGGSGGHTGHTSNHLYSSLVSDMLDATAAAQRHHKLKGWVLAVLAHWAKELFNCTCKDRPYCPCARLNVERKIYNYVQGGMRNAEEVTFRLRSDLELALFPGDVLDYLDTLIHSLRAIYAIGKTAGRESEVQGVLNIIQTLTGIEGMEILEDSDHEMPPPIPAEMGEFLSPSQEEDVEDGEESERDEAVVGGPITQTQTVHPSDIPKPPQSKPSFVRSPAQSPPPKRSPFGKKKREKISGEGLSVEDFMTHLDELANQPLPASPQASLSPKKTNDAPKPVKTPPKPPSSSQPTAVRPPVATTPAPKPEPPSPPKLSWKKSPLGKLEKRKKFGKKVTGIESRSPDQESKDSTQGKLGEDAD